MRTPCPTCRKVAVRASPHVIGQTYCVECQESWGSKGQYQKAVELAAGLRWCPKCHGAAPQCSLCYGTATR